MMVDSRKTAREKHWPDTKGEQDFMDCKEAEKLIQPYVQGNMPEKEMEPFISHIRKCHTCHEELETYFIVNRAMAYFEDDAPDSYNLTGLLERDLEKKEEEARYRRYKDTFFRVLMLILVLFLVLLALHYFGVIELPWLKGLL